MGWNIWIWFCSEGRYLVLTAPLVEQAILHMAPVYIPVSDNIAVGDNWKATNGTSGH